MASDANNANGWLNRKLAIPVKWVLVAVIVLPLLFMYVLVATSPDENVALTRNEVVEDGAGGRTWFGRFNGSSEHPYREVAVTIRFLGRDGKSVGEVSGRDELLEPGEGLDLQVPLPPGAESMQVYSLQWRMQSGEREVLGPLQSGDHVIGELLGPWPSWQFGYLQRAPSN